MRSAKEVVMDNLVWIITSLLALGVFSANIRFQGAAIESNRSNIDRDKERIICIEKSLIKIESMERDLTEIKYDIKDIKKIIFKPVISFESTKDTKDTKDITEKHTSVASIPSTPPIHPIN